jgi:sterol desaturase/sphingolipid hydroxylase (fatty acid hydroxylase superfamily)
MSPSPETGSHDSRPNVKFNRPTRNGRDDGDHGGSETSGIPVYSKESAADARYAVTVDGIASAPSKLMETHQKSMCPFGAATLWHGNDGDARQATGPPGGNMDDLAYGTRNKRGDWSPNEALEVAPFWALPPSPMKILKWLPGYFLPWNVLFIALATVIWLWATPPVETTRSFAPGWIAFLYLRNAATVFVIYGALELRLYIRRSQGLHFKYNGKWPSEQPSDVFWFRSQNVDNIIRSFGTGVPIWTAYEAFGLWCYANGYGAWTTLDGHPVWLVVFALVMPIYHEAHFFTIHRLIHVPILYKWIHSVHHNSVNPSPWSSLSMHPVEQLLYWSDSLIHLILPSHPWLFLYNLQITGVGAVVGHVGFDKIEVGGESGVATHAYAHYLHHKYFEVNYGDGTTALDKLFGTWHDGSKDGEARMQARFEKKRARLNAARQQNS